MSAPPLARYETTLRRLGSRHRLRTLAPRAGLDFASNDYLGLAGSTRLRDAIAAALARGVPAGAGGSRLLRGNHPEHEALEAEAAAFFRAERALFLGGGYTANVALLTSLPQKGDLILLDELAHASMHDGARAARTATVVTPHNDVDAMERAIIEWRKGGGVRTYNPGGWSGGSSDGAGTGAGHTTGSGGAGHPWIVIESLYSMDGDRAPLADIMALADRHEAFVLVDEAHATGVFGEDGRGLASAHEGAGRENLIVLHTCGKALGASGALVTAPRVLCDFLINRCRPFIYATAPSPLMAAAVRESLRVLRDEPERRQRLAQLIADAGVAMKSLAARATPAASEPWRTAQEPPQRAAQHPPTSSAGKQAAAADRPRSRAAAAAAPASAGSVRIKPTGSPIQPIVIGDNARTMALAAALQARGFDVRGVRPPTVPEGSARLRISLTLNVDEAAVTRLFEALGEELERMAA